MTMLEKAKRRVLRLVRRGIVRFWVHPLEYHIVPRLAVRRPTRLHVLLSRWALWCANVGRMAVLDLRVAVKRWEGMDWSAVYVGAGTSVEALGSALFPMPPETKELPHAFLWQVPALIRKLTGEGDLVVCELNEIVRLSPADVHVRFVVPVWVRQILEEIGRPMGDILAAMNQTMRRQIRRVEAEDYTYVFTQAQEDFDLFYYRMYLPYAQTRFEGRSAIVHDYETVYDHFARGGLILVKHGRDPICGMLCLLADDTCIAGDMGILDGQFELVRQGASVALWWFMLDWARRQRARHFDFGGSRAQTANGVFNWKRQWGTTVRAFEEQYTQWSFYGQNLPAPLRQHLNAQGFITQVDGRHCRVTLLGPIETLGETEVTSQLEGAARYGLTGLAMISADGQMRVLPK
jgi:hypothetical protein